MKIIITGATGSLGAYLVRYFAKKGHTVIASGKDHTPPPALKKFADYVPADIRQKISFPEADACIHTAALSDDKASVKDLYTPNVQGTGHVLEATEGCRTFIHVSSSSVYLPSPSPLGEELAGRQNNRQLSPYGSSKLQAEEVVHRQCRNGSCFILRPRALYGPGDKVILPRLLKLEKNGSLSRPGGLEVNVSMTHYENFAGAVELCLQSGLSGMHTYNVDDGRVYILLEVMRTLCTGLFGHTLPEKVIPAGLLKTLAIFKIGGITPLLVRSLTRDMVLDTTKIVRELAYQPQLDFFTAFPAINDWVGSIGGVEAIRDGEKSLAWKGTGTE